MTHTGTSCLKVREGFQSNSPDKLENSASENELITLSLSALSSCKALNSQATAQQPAAWSVVVPSSSQVPMCVTAWTLSWAVKTLDFSFPLSHPYLCHYTNPMSPNPYLMTTWGGQRVKTCLVSIRSVPDNPNRKIHQTGWNQWTTQSHTLLRAVGAERCW